MKSFSKLLVLALVFLGLNQAWAQIPTKAEQDNKIAEVSDLIAGGRYTFVATKLVLSKSDSEPLKAGYVLDISKDTLIAHLPGYGPSAAGDSALTYTHFKYEVVPEKDGSRMIAIQPDAEQATALNDIRKVKLTVSALGYGTLVVTGNKRQVTLYGYIKPPGATFPPISALH
jgi:hypothetical protein